MKVDLCEHKLSCSKLMYYLVCLCSLYLNPLSDVGKQSLYVRGVPKSQNASGRRVRVLASVTEGSDISQDWHPILSVIRKNASSWDRERVKQELKVYSSLLHCQMYRNKETQ